MSTLTLTLVDQCTGGSHLQFVLSGDRSAQRVMDRSEIEEPLTDQDLEAFIRIITRMARAGRTLNQARTLLANGVTITV